jgi:hypothetical protein
MSISNKTKEISAWSFPGDIWIFHTRMKYYGMLLDKWSPNSDGDSVFKLFWEPSEKELYSAWLLSSGYMGQDSNDEPRWRHTIVIIGMPGARGMTTQVKILELKQRPVGTLFQGYIKEIKQWLLFGEDRESSGAVCPKPEPQLQDAGDEPLNLDRLLTDLSTMRQHYKDYSSTTAREIIEALPEAWKLHNSEGGRWEPGFIARVYHLNATTIGRYCGAFKKAGISEVNDIKIP